MSEIYYCHQGLLRAAAAVTAAARYLHQADCPTWQGHAAVDYHNRLAELLWQLPGVNAGLADATWQVRLAQS